MIVPTIIIIRQKLLLLVLLVAATTTVLVLPVVAFTPSLLFTRTTTSTVASKSSSSSSSSVWNTMIAMNRASTTEELVDTDIGTKTNTGAETNNNGYTTNSHSKIKNKIQDNNILTFRSSFQAQSDLLPYLPPTKDGRTIDETFLFDPTNLLVTNSTTGTVKMTIVPTITEELYEDWRKAAQRVGASVPASSPLSQQEGRRCGGGRHHRILSVTTTGISIPGLTVEWNALIGTNIVYPHSSSTTTTTNQTTRPAVSCYPEMEFVLIRDDSTVSSGSKPLAWIFQKLTRSSSNSNHKRRTQLFTRMGFYQQQQQHQQSHADEQNRNVEEKEGLVIRSIGTIQMEYAIPSVISKLLFFSSSVTSDDHDHLHEEERGLLTNKVRAEHKISTLIGKQIEQDTEHTVQHWQSKYLSLLTQTKRQEK